MIHNSQSAIDTVDGTVCDDQGRSKIYDLNKYKEYNGLEKLACSTSDVLVFAAAEIVKKEVSRVLLVQAEQDIRIAQNVHCSLCRSQQCPVNEGYGCPDLELIRNEIRKYV